MGQHRRPRRVRRRWQLRPRALGYDGDTGRFLGDGLGEHAGSVCGRFWCDGSGQSGARGTDGHGGGGGGGGGQGGGGGFGGQGGGGSFGILLADSIGAVVRDSTVSAADGGAGGAGGGAAFSGAGGVGAGNGGGAGSPGEEGDYV